MSTAGQLVDRVYRSFLYPPDDQPARVFLAADVTATATTWTFQSGMLAADEEELFAPGVLVEAGMEQALVTAADLSARSLTVRRGANGTVASAHSADDALFVQPVFSRREVFDAVADGVVSLYPTLHHSDTLAVTVGASPTEVPASVVNVTGFTWQYGTRWMEGSVSLLDPHPPSSTGKAVQFYGVPPGRSGHLMYRSRFARPAAEMDDLQALGVEPQWERIVAVGAAAQVLGGRELDSVQQQYVTETLQAEGYPVLSAMRQAAALWEVRDRLLRQAAQSLYGSDHVPVSMQSINLSGRV